MSAYYNEIDPFSAAWLRELIKSKLIADGEVDERSIEDVTANDLRGFTQCHFFAGIGVWSHALRCAGWPGSTRLTDHARANLSARQAKEKGLMTSGTFGRRGSISSKSADLQLFLANRLKPQLERAGSTLFKMTWKESATPAGRSLFRLAASGLRTSDKDCTSWGSPRATDGSHGGPNQGDKSALPVQAGLSPWPTPATQNAEGGPNPSETKWATPSTRDWKDTAGMSQTGTNPDGSERTRLDQLPRQAALVTASGQTQSSSPAETERRGQLNPEFSLAHGYPNRVGILRGAGNAIVAPQATEFIKIAMEYLNGRVK